MIGALLVAAAAFTAPVEVAPARVPWAAAPVPGWLERETAGHLGRVRLLDAAGREVPYRLLDAATDLSSPWMSATPKNLRTTADGFRFELETPAEPVDALQIGLVGDDGVFLVEVSGGEPDGVLVADARVGRLQGVSVERVELPVTDAGRFAVRLTSLVPGLEPSDVRLRRTLRPRRGLHDGVAYRAARVPGDGDDDRWRLAATGDLERIDALRLEVHAPAVLRRRVEVHAVDAGGGSRWIGSGEIARLPLADGRRGIDALSVAVDAGAWPALELRVERAAEAPLDVVGATGETTRRWILFPHSAGAEGLRLVSGADVRSDSLERGPLPVHPSDAGTATIGSPAVTARPSPTPPPAGPSTAVSLLFVAAAGLLAVLAWRVLR